MTAEYIPGDLVIHKGEICEIMSSDNGDKRHSQYSVTCVGKGIASFRFAHEREIVPIPITTKFLEKNGWAVNATYCDYIIKDKLYLCAYVKNRKTGEVDLDVYNGIAASDSYDVCQDDFYLKSISYIHELQHLLFGLGINVKMKV